MHKTTTKRLPLYTPLPTPKEMALWEKVATEEYHIPLVVLMENASREALAVLEQQVSLSEETRIAVIMGNGNNGGDGAALARHLHNKGCCVDVYHTAPLENIKSPTREHVAMARSAGVTFTHCNEGSFFSELYAFPDVIIDALTGTGLNGPLRAKEQQIVKDINTCIGKALIISLDIPSGLDGATGKASPLAVHANVTITFSAGKPGLFLPGSQQYTGLIKVRDIGLPRSISKRYPASWQLLAPASGQWAAPSPFLHKGTAGKVMVIGGSAGMSGAPLLSCLGALCAGAGVAVLACPGALEPTIRTGYPEIMTAPIGHGDCWRAEDADALCTAICHTSPDALVIGPGMGRTAGTRTALKAVLSLKKRCPAIIDADALFFFSSGHEGNSLCQYLHPHDIVTPHPGEAAHMISQSFSKLPTTTTDIQADRPATLHNLTSRLPCVVVLKGAGTLVGQHSTPVTLSPFSVPTLAVGGSGDVLAGVCAALASQVSSSYDAATLAVYLHAKAGQKLEQLTPRGHRASAIATAIPQVLAELIHG